MLSFTRIQYIAIGLLLMVMIALSTVCLQTFKRMDQTIRERLIQQQQVTTIFGDIALDFSQAQSEFMNIQLGHVKNADKVVMYLDHVQAYIDQLENFSEDPQFNVRKEISLFTREIRRFRTALHAYITAVKDDPSTDYVKESLRQVDILIEQTVHNAKARHRNLEQMRQSTVGIILQEVDQSYGFLVVMILLSISMCIGIAVWLTGRLRSNVEDILDVTRLLGEGNLSCRLYSTHRDSLGQLCNGIDRMAEYLEQSENKLRETLIQAQQGNRIKSEFLANMSHEIRTPMTAILGFTDLVIDETDNPSSQEKLKVIQRNGRYLLEIINDILDISKIEANRLNIEQLHVDPLGLIQDIMQLHEQRCEERGLKLQLVFDTSLPKSILTDPTRFKQVVNNLLSNAIKFTETGTITIKIGMIQMQEQWQMRVQVIDTGIGMENRQLTKVFDAFSQADASTTRKYGGTGLGLTISRKLTQLLGGDLVAESTIDQGSRFTMTVNPGPLTGNFITASEHHIPGQNVKKTVSPDQEKVMLPLSDLSILFVEDGLDNQTLIKHLLTKAGADVSLADNGQIALDTLTGDDAPKFDVILMDMQMPVLDGYGATAKLRELGFDLPIIAVTANAMSHDREKCVQAGCTDFQPKPINREKLIQTILKHVNKTPSTPAL
ncbi:MAG TPA: hypothetical protein DER01_11605 [Phycisphaerales bacterium]|nr:hypothetical protein [Phycisphaerales bacterium]|tara:strand:- start:442 stop:2430 length:1989 start_codon:yes stop_codon:yes gene_type:complete